MSDELLLRSNPDAFMAVLQTPDASERLRKLKTLDDMVACEVPALRDL